jgi:dihydrofolate reductase
MRKVTYGAACSLDGYIARHDHGVDWLHWSDDVQALTSEYWATIDTVVMGRRTYEVAVANGTRAYPGVRNVVFSRTLEPAAHPEVDVVAGDAAAYVKDLRSTPGTGICVMGGGELASSLLRAGLVDEVGVNIQPVVLGGGVPLLPGPLPEMRLQLIRSQMLHGGCAYLLYRIVT